MRMQNETIVHMRREMNGLHASITNAEKMISQLCVTMLVLFGLVVIIGLAVVF